VLTEKEKFKTACLLLALASICFAWCGQVQAAVKAAVAAPATREQDFVLTCIAEGLCRRGDFRQALKVLPIKGSDAAQAYLLCLLTFKDGNRQKALAMFKRLLAPAQYAEPFNDRDLASICMRNWSQLTRQRDYRQAQLLLQTLEASAITSTKENKAQLLASLAQTFSQEGDLESARKYVDQAATLLQGHAETESLWARIFFAQAQIAAQLGDHAKAQALLTRADSVQGKNGPEKQLPRQILLSAAREAIATGKEDQAEPLLLECEGLVDLNEAGYKADLEEIYLLRLQIVEKKINAGETPASPRMVPDLSKHARLPGFERTPRDTAVKGAHCAIPVLQELGWIHKTESDYSAAENYFNHAVTLVNAQEQPVLMAQIKYELAEMALFKEDFHRASSLYESVVALLKKSGPNPVGLVWTLNRLGTMYMAQGRYQEAEKAFIESIQLEIASLQTEKKGVHLVAWSPGSGGKSLMLPELSSALSSNDLRQLAIVVEPLCNAYCAQDRIPEAESVIREVIAIKESATGQDSQDVRGSLAQLAWVLQQGTKYGEAIAVYNNLLADDGTPIRMRADSLLSRAICYDLTGSASEALNDFKEARRLYHQYLKTSVDDMRIQWLVEDIEYQLARKSSFGVDGKNYLAAVDKHPWKKEQSPLKICIDDRSDTGFDAPLRERFKTAFEQWLPPGSKMWLKYCLVDNADDANILISRVNSFDDLPSGAGGQTTYEYNEEARPASGVKKVIIRMFCPAREAANLTPRTIDRLYSLCLHEIGHALGLDGHSPNGVDIMYWKSASLKLSDRDQATLAKLYRLR